MSRRLLVIACVAVAMLVPTVAAQSAGADLANATSAVPFQSGVLGVGTMAGCVVTQTRALRCWGYGHNGALGNDSTSNIGDTTSSMESATDIPLPGPVGSVSVGADRACALLTTRKVICWGSGTGGSLGNGSTNNVGNSANSMESAASVVSLPASVQQVSTGGDHTCALLVTGEVQCWGNNNEGQLGTDSTTPAGDASFDTPTDALLPGPAVAISVGGHASCAILATGAVRCWGGGDFGVLGNDATGNIGDVPGSMESASDVPLPSKAVAISTSGENTCVILSTGTSAAGASTTAAS